MRRSLHWVAMFRMTSFFLPSSHAPHFLFFSPEHLFLFSSPEHLFLFSPEHLFHSHSLIFSRAYHILRYPPSLSSPSSLHYILSSLQSPSFYSIRFLVTKSYLHVSPKSGGGVVGVWGQQLYWIYWKRSININSFIAMSLQSWKQVKAKARQKVREWFTFHFTLPPSFPTPSCLSLPHLSHSFLLSLRHSEYPFDTHVTIPYIHLVYDGWYYCNCNSSIWWTEFYFWNLGLCVKLSSHVFLVDLWVISLSNVDVVGGE